MNAVLELVNPGDPVYLLGNSEMDGTHQEFIVLVNQLVGAKHLEFINTFQKLVDHTKVHFEREKELMDTSQFPATAEHNAEHQQILGELERFNTKVKKGQFTFARAYVKEKLPDWFRLHLSMMDSALVAHLNTQIK